MFTVIFAQIVWRTKVLIPFKRKKYSLQHFEWQCDIVYPCTPVLYYISMQHLSAFISILLLNSTVCQGAYWSICSQSVHCQNYLFILYRKCAQLLFYIDIYRSDHLQMSQMKLKCSYMSFAICNLHHHCQLWLLCTGFCVEGASKKPCALFCFYKYFIICNAPFLCVFYQGIVGSFLRCF